MMLLPTRYSDGCAIDLPIHPNQHYHQVYSAKVKLKVKEPHAPYNSIVNNAVNKKKDPPDPEPEDVKDDIVEISQVLHSEIVNNRANIKRTCQQGGDITVDSLAPSVAKWIGV